MTRSVRSLREAARRALARLWPARARRERGHEGRWRRHRDASILAGAFGPGSRRSFAWYLERESAVRVHSIRELCDWLRGCAYVGDREHLGVEDHWMHPVDFERVRRGDCEDHALWAWRKARELAVPASLVAGELDGRPHVWVMLAVNEELHLLEPTQKEGEMLQPATGETAGRYRPRYAVDTALATYRYEPDTARGSATPSERAEGRRIR